MRDIKFRAWDEREEKIYYDVFAFPGLWTEDAILIEPEMFLYAIDYKTKQFTLLSDNSIEMQYTGLKDKNGREIYEGDILEDSWSRWEVKFSHEYIKDNECYLDNYSIGFHLYKLSYDKRELYEPRHFDMELDDTEVIGNIYENPELFGKKK